MPLNYAHYRFGVAMLDAMPADIRRTAKRFRRLYDIGLHGPDIFFYHNPLQKPILGKQLHRQTGKECFSRACRSLRLTPSQEAEAYLYGLLCHYVLDSVCHPFVREHLSVGTHIEIETEFDRFLLELDRKIPPERQDLSLHIQLAPRECATVARFYPGVTEKMVSAGVRNMALATKALAKGNRWLQTGRKLVHEKYRGVVMTQEPNPRCSALNPSLLALYGRAEEKFPVLLMQLSAHLTYNAPLEGDFLADFG